MMVLLQRPDLTFYRPVLEPGREFKMMYQKLIKEIRLEISEANAADKERAYVRAKACLLRAKELIEKNIKKGGWHATNN